MKNRLQFRVWYKRKKEMIYFSFSDMPTEPVEIPVLIQRNEIEIMQSTGLMDKNQNKIFFGDIVKISYGFYKKDTDPNHDDVDYPVKKGTINHIVSYTNCAWSGCEYGNVKFRPIMTKKQYSGYKNKLFVNWNNNMWWIEIIGNIFEEKQKHLLNY